MNMDSSTKFVLTVFSFCSIVYTTYSVINFAKFLSDFPPSGNSSLIASKSIPLEDSNAAVTSTTEAVVVDISLMCIFIIVHSSLIPVQDILSSILKMPVLNQMFYSLLTSASLQLLSRWWVPIPQYTLWAVESHEFMKPNVFLGVHIISWILMGAVMITMDVTDLLGFKQVYFHMTGRPPPVKSEQLKHLHRKMRHPSFIGFLMIFWIYPYMRLDRLLLASIWTVYMLLAWRPDTYSYNYLVQQNIAKRSVL